MQGELDPSHSRRRVPIRKESRKVPRTHRAESDAKPGLFLNDKRFDASGAELGQRQFPVLYHLRHPGPAQSGNELFCAESPFRRSAPYVDSVGFQDEDPAVYSRKVLP